MTASEPTGRLAPTTGLAVLHLFGSLAPTATGGPDERGPAGDRSGAVDRAAMVSAVKQAEADGVQVVTVAMLGHKADLGIMALAEDLWLLRRLQTQFQDAGLRVTYSYVSLTEVSEYAQGLPEEMKQARLYPNLPPEGMESFCFYPMSKRRGEDEGSNWYSLSFDDRKALMLGHGSVGRTFAGRILQLITGSTGIDDWEWGVTLFGRHPDDLKDCVYRMRFDEASARFAEFGPFLVGMVAPLETVLESVVGHG